jgi:very-short-patch-repair endonuclease
LRNEPTEGERALWQLLRRRQLAGHRFRRQVPIGPFIVDFACLERRVVVEVDGSSHDNPIKRKSDAERDAWISAQRFRILRLQDGEVLENPAAALGRIREFLGVEISNECTTPTPPSPVKGEGDRDGD